MKFPNYIFLLGFVFLTFGAQAQQDLSLHFVDHVWQARQTNQAMMSENRINITLPSPYFNFYHSAFTFNDIFTKIRGTDSLVLDLSDAIEEMNSDNYYNTQFNLGVLGVGLRFKKLQVNASYSIRTSAYLNYPKTLVDMVWNGNAKYLGKTVNIAPDFQAFAYNEIALGGAYQITEKLSIGAGVKFLSGIADISAANRTNLLNITTDSTFYEVTLNNDYQFNGSSFPYIDSTFSSFDGEFNVEKLFAGNTGLGIDLGATYQLNDKLLLAASVNDLGFINWTANVRNYKSEGAYTYDGIDISPLLSGDTVTFDAVLDTLVQVFDIEPAQNSSSYKTRLGAKIYLSAKYKLKESLTLGGLFYGEIYRGRLVPGIALSASKDFGKIFTLGGVYSIRNNRFMNLGLNTTLRMGPVHLFLVSDNILPLFAPFNSRNFNFRIGLNVAVGKE